MDEIEDLFDEPEPIEAYCVSCKQKVEIEDPVAVWTSKGQAATRGFCSVCGTNVFRMGRTHLHSGIHAPKAIQVIPAGAKGRAARAAYIAAAVTDSEFAQQLADDLKKLGINVWVEDGTQEVDTTQWAGGVHPALEQCSHLIVILSGFTGNTASVQSAWEYFLKERKPVAVGKIEEVEPPDPLRSRRRFDFVQDYKIALRGLVDMISG